MSEEFKRKLQDYADGKLSDEEREEVEQEIEKMEAYQLFLEGTLAPESQEPSMRQTKIIRRGKWRARIANAATVLSIVLAVTFISSIITNLFYSLGEPSRMETYKDVVSSTIAVTRPNIRVHLNGQGNYFFTMDTSGKLTKAVGDGSVTVGDYSFSFLLSRPGRETIAWLDENGEGGAYFKHPSIISLGEASDREWERLEKLPEGTVAEAYISFDRLVTTDELLKRFEHLNMLPLWFAVDTGAKPRSDSGIILDTIGFPYFPLWHHDDMKVVSYSEKKTGLFSKVTTKETSNPTIAAYGDGELRNDNFMKTLVLLQKYKSITKRAAPSLNIDETIQYLESNGVKLYGAVVTGPTKELLKLRQQSWVNDIRVGEVRLWNWNDRN